MSAHGMVDCQLVESTPLSGTITLLFLSSVVVSRYGGLSVSRVNPSQWNHYAVVPEFSGSVTVWWTVS